MAVAIRGTTPATTSGTSDPISLTLTGARQPQTNDVLVIVHANNFYELSNMSTPTVGGSSTGVTAITNGTADGGTNAAHAKSYTYVVGSTGDLTVEVDETGTADEEKLLAVYVLSGVDTATPIDIAGSTYVGTSENPHVAPSVSPTSADAYLICHVGAASDTSPYAPPGSMTEQYDFDVGSFMAGAGATEQLVASGATGTRSFTADFSNTYLALSIAVKTGAAAAAEPGQYSRFPMPGRINPDRRVYLFRKFDIDTVQPVEEVSVGATSSFTAISTANRLLRQPTARITSQGFAVEPVTGTVAVTQDDQTMAASGTAAEAAAILGTVVASSAATTAQRLLHQPPLVFQDLGPPVVAEEQTAIVAVLVVGTAATTAQRLLRQPRASSPISAPTVSAGVTGAIAATQDDQTMAASGTVTQPVLTVTAVASSAGATAQRLLRQPHETFTDLGPPVEIPADVTGTIAVTQQDQTMTASGIVTGIVIAVVVVSSAPAMAKRLTSQPFTTGLFTPPAPAGPVTGTVAASQADQTMTASGAVVNNVTGTVAVIQDNQTMVASGDAQAPASIEPIRGGAPIRHPQKYGIRRPGWG